MCYHIVDAASQTHPIDLVETSSLSHLLGQKSKIFAEQTVGVTSRMVRKVEFLKTSGCNESKVVDECLRNNFFSHYLLHTPPSPASPSCQGALLNHPSTLPS